MRVTDEEERARLLLRQGAAQAARGRVSPGRFIPAEWQGMAMHEAREADVAVTLDGGHPDAERLQVCFHPREEEPRFTARWLEISWNARFASPDHRDLLGSLMGLGIDRAYMGDLVTGEGRAWLYALEQLAERLPAEWTQAGRTTLTVKALEEAPELPAASGQRVRVTVPGRFPWITARSCGRITRWARARCSPCGARAACASARSARRRARTACPLWRNCLSGAGDPSRGFIPI